MIQIGLAAIMYANDHGGHFPDDVQTILKEEDLAPAVFNCPVTNDTPATGPTTQATLSDFQNPGHLSYIYVGKGLKMQTASADVVVLYEPLAHHKDGMNVLFGDGHAEWYSAADAQTILKQAASGVRPIRVPADATATQTAR